MSLNMSLRLNMNMSLNKPMGLFPSISDNSTQGDGTNNGKLFNGSKFKIKVNGYYFSKQIIKK
jgi:hypothetical protein